MSSATSNSSLTTLIREKSLSLGFDITGIARAKHLSSYESRLREWVADGMNDTMNYLSRDIEKRADPSLLFPEVRSIIVTGMNYYTETGQNKPGVPVISRYAYGRDYHIVIKEKLGQLLTYIKTVDENAEGRIWVDSSPALEKPWAVEAGLGWQGRHSVVINRNIGSFFFICILALNKELEYDNPFSENLCGDCRACIEHCPTGAINEDNTIDARKCISNLTIENRGPLPENIIPLMGGRVYACDKCQEVCPWNKHAVQHNHPEFTIKSELAEMTREMWSDITIEKFADLFDGTPIARVKFDRFKTNIGIMLDHSTLSDQ